MKAGLLARGACRLSPGKAPGPVARAPTARAGGGSRSRESTRPARAPTDPAPRPADRRQRRRWSKDEKLRIIREADACTERGTTYFEAVQRGIIENRLAELRTQRRRAKSPADRVSYLDSCLRMLGYVSGHLHWSMGRPEPNSEKCNVDPLIYVEIAVIVWIQKRGVSCLRLIGLG